MSAIHLLPTPMEYAWSDAITALDTSRVRVMGCTGARLRHGLSLLDSGAVITDAADITVRCGEDFFGDLPVGDLFTQPHAREQGYLLLRDEGTGRVEIAACSEMGCVYALMTLLQLRTDEGFPAFFTVRDRPDFLWRGNRWLHWAEAGIWSYDRGDGLDALLRRCIEKLDMNLRCKINVIAADAFGWATDRFPGYNEFMRSLNREARLRGIHILSGGYGMGYGMIGHGKGVYQGKAHLNRESYPDGAVYPCLGCYDYGHPESDLKGREYGTCLSNEALMEEKLRELTHFVRTVEPGALYIHNMDADQILEPLWASRCDKCREKWPSDCLWDENGAAGAFASFINRLCAGIRSVKTDAYDANLDCMISIISPGYMYAHSTNDDSFRKGRLFWQAVSRLLDDHALTFIGFRELFFNHADRRLRYDMLREGWGKCNFASFYFSGGDGFYSDRLFLGCGLFNYAMKASPAIINENGNANEEPQQLLNAEYLWNCEHSAYYNLPARPTNYEDFMALYHSWLLTEPRPAEIYGEGGLLEVICGMLYGEGAARDMAALYALRGEHYEAPLVSPCSCEIFTNFTKVVYPMRWENTDLPLSGAPASVLSMGEKFRQIVLVTQRAAQIVTNVLEKKRYLPSCEADLLWMRDNFTLCARYAVLLTDYMGCFALLLPHFTDAAPIPDSLIPRLEAIAASADALEAQMRASTLIPSDVLGGALVHREKLADFIAYNCRLMLASIRESSRLPALRRPTPVRSWW